MLSSDANDPEPLLKSIKSAAKMDQHQQVRSTMQVQSLVNAHSEMALAADHAEPVIKNILEEEDPLTCIKNLIKWKGDTGYLPGSVCRFKLDLHGDLQLTDDHEEESDSKRQKLATDNISNETIFSEMQELLMCKNCGKYGFKDEFFKNGQYCKDCAHINPVYFKMFRNLSMLFDSKTSNSVRVEPIATAIAPQTNNSEHTGKSFNWDTYLEKNNYIAIPTKSFLPSQQLPTKPNKFKVGMKLEGIDPYHPSRFCVLSVADIQGCRLRLHFDGYKKKFDFWQNSNNEFIFPAGFCKSTGRKLEPPLGISSDSFDWETYLSETNSIAAPNDCFVVSKEDPEKLKMLSSLGFNLCMRLEAVDKANNVLTCVASIRDILNEHLLIHFDGWDDSYDYWAHYTSNYIHPINWCKSKGKPLTAPKDYRTDSFSWEEYLHETDSTAVPARAFKPKPATNWRSGMKLEAVDIRNPTLIRVASIAGRMGHTVRIHFDGWEDKYDYWIDDDSANLHPIFWCAHSGHALQALPSDSKSKKLCPTPHCNGLGHKNWYNHKRHRKVEDCPYVNENLDYEPPDRFECSDDDAESERNDDAEEDIEDDEESEEEEEVDELDGIGEKNMFGNTFSSYSYGIIREEHKRVASRLESNHILNLKQLLSESDSLRVEPKEVITWDYDRVEQFILRLTDCPATARIFAEQCIDGEAFLMLRHEDLTQRLHIKLGPVAKIYSAIEAIRFSLCEGQ